MCQVPGRYRDRGPHLSSHASDDSGSFLTCLTSSAQAKNKVHWADAVCRLPAGYMLARTSGDMPLDLSCATHPLRPVPSSLVTLGAASWTSCLSFSGPCFLPPCSPLLKSPKARLCTSLGCLSFTRHAVPVSPSSHTIAWSSLRRHPFDSQPKSSAYRTYASLTPPAHCIFRTQELNPKNSRERNGTK
jgi:hypothetical protein